MQTMNTNPATDHISARLCDDSLLADALRTFFSHPSVAALLLPQAPSCLAEVTRAFNRTVRSPEEQDLVDSIQGHVEEHLDFDHKVQGCIERDSSLVSGAVREYFDGEPRWFNRMLESEIENRLASHDIAKRMMERILDEPDRFFNGLFANASPELLDRLAATLASRLRIVHPDSSTTPYESC
jgi:hypothetical protein